MTPRVRNIIAGSIALAAIIILVVVFTSSSSNAPSATTTTTAPAPTVHLTATDCRTAKLTFAAPGSPAITKSGTYVDVTVTNHEGRACSLPRVSEDAITNFKTDATTVVSGYGLVFAQAYSNATPVGPVSILRGTAGSRPLSIALAPKSNPTAATAAFVFGVTPAAKISGCDPEKVTTIEFSIDNKTWQKIDFAKNPYFTSGLKICTGDTANLNTSPIALIPLSALTPTKHHGVTTTTSH